MAIRIQSEAQMHQIRSGMHFCYLCGTRLRESDEIDLDHIPPQALFDAAPKGGHWRPSIPVHTKCHKKKNRESEQIAILLHKLYTECDENAHERNWMKRVAALQLELGTTFDESTWQTMYRVKGFDKSYEAVWSWVRGMHAILYGVYLPPLMRHMTHAPMGEMYVPPKDARGIQRRTPVSAKEFAEKKSHLTNVIDVAMQSRLFDGLKCWGNTCAFVATWLNGHNRIPRCFWALQYDGTTEYVDGTPFQATPWVGWYECVRAPDRRSILSPG